MTDIQEKIIRKAQNKILEYHDSHMANSPEILTDFKIGTWVLVKPHENVWGRGRSKLLPNNKGPYKVVSKNGNLYSVWDNLRLKSIIFTY